MILTLYLFITNLPYQILAGVGISLLLLFLMVFRELAIASQDQRWIRISRYLIIPIVPLVLAFLILAFWRIEAFENPSEFKKVLVGGIDVTRAFGREPTPTPYQPATATASPTPAPTLVITPSPVPTRTPFQPGAGSTPEPRPP